MKNNRIFISYSSRDRRSAEHIQQQIEVNGFDVWRDVTRLETDWSREIAEALAKSACLCLLWTKSAAQSRWVNHEWLTARALEKYIIICCLPDAPSVPPPLQNLHFVLFDDFDDGVAELIRRLKSKKNFHENYDYTVLPKNSYIPFNPNPCFTGRKMDLLNLYLQMVGNLNKIGINQVGAVGMGGIGKTQLAVEFAYRFSFSFDSIFWIQAAHIEQWRHEFVSLARDRLQLPIPDPSSPEAEKQYIYALQKHLKDRESVLLIMDNVSDPKMLNSAAHLFGIPPLAMGCDLLFTTRKHFQLSGVSSHPVDILDPEGAYELLEYYRQASTPEEARSARAICNAVGYLPLAITLAGAYLRESDPEISFAVYHEELVKNRLGVIDIGDLSSEELATRHDAAITTTLQSQWEMLTDLNAKKLFQLAGQFPEAQIIPKARLGLLAGIAPGVSKLDQPLAKAFRRLEGLNLVEHLLEAEDAIRLHPLVRDFSDRLISEEQRLGFRAGAANEAQRVYFDLLRLESEVRKRNVRQIIGDLNIAIRWCSPDAAFLHSLELLHGALRLSVNILAGDNTQLRSQLYGRLQSIDLPEIESLLLQMTERRDNLWLRPITTGLEKPGGLLLYTLLGHSGKIEKLIISPDGKIAGSADDKTIIFWDLDLGEAIETVQIGVDIIDFTITSKGRPVIFKREDADLVAWDVIKKEDLYRLYGLISNLSKISLISSVEGTIAVLTDGRLIVWHVDNGEKLGDLQIGEDIMLISVSTDRRIAVMFLRGALQQWDLITGSLLQANEIKFDKIHLTPEGDLACIVHEGRIDIWDLQQLKV
ncbi:MAG: TIR domain-containing protein, partial [Acidobacteria bacterium]|nr:TIR domain-containing protein [Acidobacteriota bacterium]